MSFDKILNIIKQRIQEFKEECKIYLELLQTTPKDCRWQLLNELLMNPVALRERYEQEKTFQRNMMGCWKKQP